PRRRSLQRRRPARAGFGCRLHRLPFLAGVQRRGQLHRDRDRAPAGVQLRPDIALADLIRAVGIVMSAGSPTVVTPRLDMWLRGAARITPPPGRPVPALWGGGAGG